MALDFHCVSVLPGASSRTLGEAAAWRQPGIHGACVPSRGMAVQPSLLGPGCFTQQKAARLTTWLKSETKDVFVLCEECAVSVLGFSSLHMLRHMPPLLTPLTHLFPFPSKRGRAGSKRLRRERDTTKPRTSLGQREAPDGKRSSEGKPVAPIWPGSKMPVLTYWSWEQAAHSSWLASSRGERKPIGFPSCCCDLGFETGAENTAGKH